MNKVIMMGRLTRDPEIRYSQGQNETVIAAFSIAVDRRFKREGEPEADFFNCTAFGKLGGFVEKYLRKGVKIVLTGRIQNDSYTNRDGQKVTSTKIVADEIEFAESKSAPAGSQYGDNTSAQSAEFGRDGFMNIPTAIDDEIPFS